jgi:glycogen debranching enzyme
MANPAMTAPKVSEPTVTPFYIPATTSFQEHRPRTLKHGDSFAVFDDRGDISDAPGSPEGLYHADTRILSRLDLLLNGSRLLLLSSTTQDDNAVFSADLTNPDMMSGGQIALPRDLIHVNRRKFLWNAACYEQLFVRNFDSTPRFLRLGLHFGADFADLFEVRGQKRSRRGTSSAERTSDDSVTLRYFGLDGIERITLLSFDPVPHDLDTAAAAFEFLLEPGQGKRLFLRVGPPDLRNPEWRGQCFYQNMRTVRQALKRASERATSVDSPNSLFNEMAHRSLSDLHMLVTETPYGPYPYAGIPWFSTPFGRDGLITALMTLWLDPTIAKGVVRFLAAHQATDYDPERDAEPGKILHEMRFGEMARLREVPFERYYGSVDATPLFVLVLGEYFERTGDIETVRTLWPNVEAALRWIDTDGDPDGDGLVEYNRKNDNGLVNQGWKDSSDAIFHEDGRLAIGPIALCEVQSYVYGAKRNAAAMAEALGLVSVAVELRRQAETLRQKFEATFWCEDLSTYAMALDGEKKPCKVVSSNAGHALLTGLADPDRARRVAKTLLGSACFSGWGIRTVALSAKRYNPMSYHNGSVWPHDNALIALGLSRYGLKNAVREIFKGLLDATAYMDLRRLPELFCGFSRRQGNAPTLYPVACIPQAWASTTIFGLLQATLGLRLDRKRAEIRFDRPILPDLLDELHLRGLRLGDGTVDVLLHRHENEVAATLTRRQGDFRVVVVQ